MTSRNTTAMHSGSLDARDYHELRRHIERLEGAVVELSQRAYRDDYGKVWWPIKGPIAGIRRRFNSRKRLADQMGPP